ncbi:hypothetical protein HMPREF0742_02587 [Rothia aeria F0184]|uniref:Uncharacterized protein n=1 Tax=Rothia aeria F0184 TaxID=888019 RepID=U7UWP4_9MICC|nr:hypothetical protein HMPREF0742_02587 [Rothia aeria F0184]
MNAPTRCASSQSQLCRANRRTHHATGAKRRISPAPAALLNARGGR